MSDTPDAAPRQDAASADAWLVRAFGADGRCTNVWAEVNRGRAEVRAAAIPRGVAHSIDALRLVAPEARTPAAVGEREAGEALEWYEKVREHYDANMAKWTEAHKADAPEEWDSLVRMQRHQRAAMAALRIATRTATPEAPEPVAHPDGASPQEVLAYVRQCAAGWEGEARLLGNARAADIVRAIDATLRTAPPAVPQGVRDTERLDWLHQTGAMVEAFTDGTWHVTPPGDGSYPGGSLRAAIDAALRTLTDGAGEEDTGAGTIPDAS